MALSAGRFYATWLPKLAVGKGEVPSSYEEFGELAKHLRFVERHAQRLARSTFYGMARWQAGLADKEMFLGRLVDIGAELFAITCTVVHAQAVVDDMPDRRPDVMAVSDHFCRQARRRVTGLFGDLWSNDEDQGYRLARQVLDGQHEWLEKGMVDPLEAQEATGVDHDERTPGTDATMTIDDLADRCPCRSMTLPIIPCRQDRRTARSERVDRGEPGAHRGGGRRRAKDACAAQAVYRLYR